MADILSILNLKDISTVSILIIAVFFVSKAYFKNINKQEEERRKEKVEDKIERQEMYSKLDNQQKKMYSEERERHKEEKERHVKEEAELKGEIKFLHSSYLEKMDKFDNSLNENTKVLREVSDNVKDIKEVKADVEQIKRTINSRIK